MTAIMVTHDVDEAVYLSDKVVVMTPAPRPHHRHARYPALPPACAQLGGLSPVPRRDPVPPALRRQGRGTELLYLTLRFIGDSKFPYIHRAVPKKPLCDTPTTPPKAAGSG